MVLLSFTEKNEKCISQNPLTVLELIMFLTKKNDNVMVYVKKIYTDAKNGIKIYEMSNGFSYTKNEDGKWYILT